LIKEKVSIYEVVELLNSALKLDREALENLCFNRAKCNKKLADHPTIQVHCYDENGITGKYSVGLIGILNGIFEVNKDGWGAIAASVEDNQINEFIVLKDRLSN